LDPTILRKLAYPHPPTSGFVFLLLLGSFCEREECVREFVFVGGMRRMREGGGAFSACVLFQCETVNVLSSSFCYVPTDFLEASTVH
jgi:hypothetical protein